MRTLMLALVAVLGLSAVVDAASPVRRNYNSSGANNNSGWQKGYGWAGYGFYNAYGDYVGSDGYTAIKAGPRRIYTPGAAYGYPAPPYGYSRTSNFGY